MPLFREIEMPLVSVLTEMECTGVKIDTEALNEYALLLTREMNAVEEEIYSLAGTRFNIGSPKQLGEVLFEKLKIAENVKKTKTKQYATSEEVLLELRAAHPVVEKILDYRSYKKLLSTYVEALPRLINPTTGKIHTSYNRPSLPQDVEFHQSHQLIFRCGMNAVGKSERPLFPSDPL
jgi:DNA polymerase-1